MSGENQIIPPSSSSQQCEAPSNTDVAYGLVRSPYPIRVHTLIPPLTEQRFHHRRMPEKLPSCAVDDAYDIIARCQTPLAAR